MSRDSRGLSQMMSQIEFNDFNDVAPSQINRERVEERKSEDPSSQEASAGGSGAME
jgi:hypothetical protein